MCSCFRKLVSLFILKKVCICDLFLKSYVFSRNQRKWDFTDKAGNSETYRETDNTYTLLVLVFSCELIDRLCQSRFWPQIWTELTENSNNCELICVFAIGMMKNLIVVDVMKQQQLSVASVVITTCRIRAATTVYYLYIHYFLLYWTLTTAETDKNNQGKKERVWYIQYIYNICSKGAVNKPRSDPWYMWCMLY